MKFNKATLHSAQSVRCEWLKLFSNVCFYLFFHSEHVMILFIIGVFFI